MRIPLDVDRRTLERQIDRLYRDPLNAFLPLDHVAFIAGEQIKGKSMDAELKRLRPLAYERYQTAKRLLEKR
ncbi:hypothetical protein CBM2626_U40005 [Cupriavidus taiwanensis]|uniref:Uncharacterized protein n=1 Tax=Cupriavidus taiwanensis TaxID=164546 RepID=A0A375FIE2_9BURK|nr:hypothetical protein [Cupriavidus taiwanensis]SOZ73337.1 hypothetical protein CBM2614_U40005 [Cupriavidus taiwanensis]SOZ73880.1 hypothetical protein CBM2615_U30005 [Cupriavidus taiwanensis]SOZ75321.1 hypothetical protein CBM2613_U30005 [Cupriavidus taiwanensis]SPA03867.1 hypothetical protein CBM2626_U40005 [Cupriavidus taiwanensis]SPA12950.1 hypothetical protein CBM2625_U70016 [Cupriavidus taiwanensis]